MMAGSEYCSRSEPTGRSPSSVKLLCCDMRACYCGRKSRTLVSLWLQRYEEKRGEGAKVVRFSEMLAHVASQLRSGAKKRGTFRSKAPHFLHTVPCFPRFAPVPSPAAGGRRRPHEGCARRGGALHANARSEGSPQTQKTPSSPRRGRGVRPQNDRVWVIKGLCSCL